MSQLSQGPRKSFVAASDLSTKQFYIMKLATAANTVDLASSPTSEILIGALQNKPKAAEPADVALLSGGGTAKVIAGGAITKGDMLTADSAGKAVATTTVGNKVIGMALETAANGAGDIVEYMPCQHHRYAATS